MSGWFHPRLCDVFAFRPLSGTEAGRVKPSHRLKTVFCACAFGGTESTLENLDAGSDSESDSRWHTNVTW
jgi:hypothetical protein